MPDADGLSSSWDNSTDNSEFQTSAAYRRPPLHMMMDVPGSPTASTSNGLSISPPTQHAMDTGETSSMNWRDTSTVLSDGPESIGEAPQLLEPGFDESLLRMLCDMDCGTPLLLDRIKQSMISCREASLFLRKRAAIEEEYGKTLAKLSKTTSDMYATTEAKAGTFVTAWNSTMRIHDQMAENRLRFAQRLHEMSDELNTLSKEVDKNRKSTKDLATRYERALLESESITEKCKTRLDLTSEELERLLLQKEGESFRDGGVQRGQGGGVHGKRVIGKAVAKGGLLLKGKNPGNIQRQEEDIRGRMSAASDAYRKAVTDTQTLRQEYYNFQLPRILRSLKECVDEIDLGTQYHLTRYAFLFESIVLSDGTTLVPPREEGTGRGLKATFEMIDNRGDFRTFMQNYHIARGGHHLRMPRRDGPAEEGFVPPIPSYNGSQHTPELSPVSSHPPRIINLDGPPSDKGRPTFGVDLAEQMARDDVDVPPIMKCLCETIEKHGRYSQGIYRISGMQSKVNRLKELLDKDLDGVNLEATEWVSDISVVASVMKLWLRDLPDPLIAGAQQIGFMEAARIDTERLRQIRLHERVNELPDANYATLKFFLGHLHALLEFKADTQMDIRNFSIVFGPTLFGQVVFGMPNTVSAFGDPQSITDVQSRAVEKILEYYREIFVDETD
ncbi:Rho GTPase activation protein [Cylindrobasidium torrendii FP15055 ss-10]|uniref:Rho GTPase activation protein n=1 Tax=Cylindrobasidium torrendii FP15055 ss-10 TaxID=1314674 RepID=A0A0D7AZ56_9AGAR|nr:Rho GTPase activation protein [Cylindrobasidium torrendii FP15055 ss-10]